ncbi:uncharacterized protein LOC131892973 [Tigriopus californicus]|uniref:uncharacterized protein LOC131892973 n=1 Tax=Tigriopus californicus TaxID=6832 RepID=UPI0027DA04DE|nr:uncharacterized protein LOC131892973 [Tigriopus californicus]
MHWSKVSLLIMSVQIAAQGNRVIRREVFNSITRKDLEIAKCQASCQQHYPHHSQASFGPNRQCWKFCQSLSVGPDTPQLCENLQLCPEPCQVACAAILARQPVIKTSNTDPTIMSPPVLSHCTLTWTEPRRPSGNHQVLRVPSTPIEAAKVYLYVVYAKDRKGKWKRMTKTTQTAVDIPKATMEAIQLIKVVAMTGTGFVGESNMRVKKRDENECTPAIQRVSHCQRLPLLQSVTV